MTRPSRCLATSRVAGDPVIDPREGDLFVHSHVKFVLQCLGNTFEPELGVVGDAHRR